MIFLSTLLVAGAGFSGTATQASTLDPAVSTAGDAHSASTLFPKHRRWPKRLIRYHLDYPAVQDQVTEAARLWNESGANVRWQAVPARQAEVTITRVPMKKYWGWAGQLWKPGRKHKYKPGVTGGSIIKVDPRVAGFARSAPSNGLLPEERYMAVQIIAHEMGHILGLAHTDGCAVMSSGLKADCPAPPVAGVYRCRVLEADDVRGAVRLFGGTFRRPTGNPWCAVEGAPDPVEDATVTYQPNDPAVKGENTLLVSYRMPAKNLPSRVGMKIAAGQCPTEPTGALWAPAWNMPEKSKGAHVLTALTPGEYCASFFSRSRRGVIGESHATALFSVPD